MANTEGNEGREVLVYRPKDKDDKRGKVTVYGGTGMFDALSTDPEWELVEGDPGEGSREAPAKTKVETGPKTDMVPDPTLVRGEAETKIELGKLDRAELDSKALDVGVKDAASLPNKGAVIDAIIEAERAIHGPASP